MAFLGIKGGIKGFFNGIGKRIKKTVKRVGRGLTKAGKKLRKSKVLKALAIAAAVIVTGGAAIGAFGGSLATSGFGSWMMAASNTITGFTVGGLNVGAVFKPLATAGKFIGGTAGKLTDLTGLTSEASRAGYTQIQPLGGGVVEPSNVGEFVVDPSKTTMDGRTLAKLKGSTDTIHGTGTMIDAAGNVVKLSPESLIDPATGEAVAATQGFFDTTAGQVTQAVGTTVLGSTLSGVAANYIAGDPATQGAMAGAAYEGASNFDPLRVYASSNNINTNDIYSHLLYGNSDPSTMYGNDLFKQQTFQVA